MHEITLEAYAKVNLALDVLYKREDGYHEINSIMQQINLCDKLTFSDHKDDIIIQCNSKELPLDSSNLVYRAWEKIKEVSGIDKGIKISIQKNIPIAAGLAGGSANGAMTLKALNTLWDLGYSDEKLMEIGKTLGADIPFCIFGGSAKAEGIGEKLTRLKPFKDKYILIANPGIGISTAYAYSKIDLNSSRYDINALINAMEREDLLNVAANLKNRMEVAILKEYPIIQEIKTSMIKNGALGSLMSGSGPTVFGLFDDYDKMEFANKKLSITFEKVYSCTTI